MTMKNKKRFYIIACILMLIIYVLSVDILFLTDVVKFASANKLWEDEYSSYEKRFKCVKKHIYSNIVVGYLGDSTTNYGYNLAQYALAPNIIVNSPATMIVLGNFDNDGGNYFGCSAKGLSIINDCGNGVVLFKREIK
jgi:hypothetical protein